MKALIDSIERVAQTDASILVRGDTGSGKELVARAIHAASDRKRAPSWPSTALHCRHRCSKASCLVTCVVRLPVQCATLQDSCSRPTAVAVARRDRRVAARTAGQIATGTRRAQRNSRRGPRTCAIDVRFVSATHRALREAVRRTLSRRSHVSNPCHPAVFAPTPGAPQRHPSHCGATGAALQ